MSFKSIHQLDKKFKVNEDWHQVTFYNDQNDKELKITVNLFDPQEEGGLGLDSVKAIMLMISGMIAF